MNNFSYEMISPRDAKAFVEKDPQAKFLDVRSTLEFDQVHIKDSINLPLDMFPDKINELRQSKQTYVVLCRMGQRSSLAADMLAQSGIHGVRLMQGGIINWQKEKFPVVLGEGGVSLERQVRAIAGCLVLAGILMSWLVHWAFVFFSVFVGCGLIYAGLTDSCLMGVLLMKLPYNRKLYKIKSDAQLVPSEADKLGGLEKTWVNWI